MAFAEEPPRRAKRRGVVRTGIRAGGIGCVGCFTFLLLALLALILFFGAVFGRRSRS
jgi:predicted metal-binding membrane protein